MQQRRRRRRTSVRADRQRHLTNRNEMRVLGSTTATDGAVVVVYDNFDRTFTARQHSLHSAGTARVNQSVTRLQTTQNQFSNYLTASVLFLSFEPGLRVPKRYERCSCSCSCCRLQGAQLSDFPQALVEFIVQRRSSVIFGGNVFCTKTMCEKLAKCPNQWRIQKSEGGVHFRCTVSKVFKFQHFVHIKN